MRNAQKIISGQMQPSLPIFHNAGWNQSGAFFPHEKKIEFAVTVEKSGKKRVLGCKFSISSKKRSGGNVI